MIPFRRTLHHTYDAHQSHYYAYTYSPSVRCSIVLLLFIYFFFILAHHYLVGTGGRGGNADASKIQFSIFVPAAYVKLRHSANVVALSAEYTTVARRTCGHLVCSREFHSFISFIFKLNRRKGTKTCPRAPALHRKSQSHRIENSRKK